METQTSKQQQESVDPVSRFMWALSFPGVSHAARLVLAALAYHADQQKLTCWPAVETLARETQVSRAWRPVRLAEIGDGWSDSNRAIQRQIQQLVPADDCPQPCKDCAPQPRKDCAGQPCKDCAPTAQGLRPPTAQGLRPNRVIL